MPKVGIRIIFPEMTICIVGYFYFSFLFFFWVQGVEVDLEYHFVALVGAEEFDLVNFVFLEDLNSVKTFRLCMLNIRI